MSRLPVRKTYKLFLGGDFPRSESGRTYEAEGQNVARASRKDAREAVVAARKAQPGWAGATLAARFGTATQRSSSRTYACSPGRPPSRPKPDSL